MKIVMISNGTRGDMEPFLAIGEILQERVHPVTCAFPEQFRHLALETSLGFASLGSDYIQILESEAGQAAMGGGSSGLVHPGCRRVTGPTSRYRLDRL